MLDVIPVCALLHMPNQAAKRVIKRWWLLAPRYDMPWAHALPINLIVDYSAVNRHYLFVEQLEFPHWSHFAFATVLASLSFSLEVLATETTQVGILQQAHVALDTCRTNASIYARLTVAKALASFFAAASVAISVCIAGATLRVSALAAKSNTCAAHNQR